MDEICDDRDNDCDGEVDELDEVSANDDRIGGSCDEPEVGKAEAPCQAGTMLCRSGEPYCDGAIKAGEEICDGEDNNCDGIVDDPTEQLCSNGIPCVYGRCAVLCLSGEFPCPSGRSPVIVSEAAARACVCLTEEQAVDASGGGTGGTTGTGTGGTTGVGPEGGTGADGGIDDGKDGGLGTAGASAGGANGTGTAGASGPDPGGSAGDNRFGLATGGGGCACRTTAPLRPGGGLYASLLLLAGVIVRRRTRRAA